MEVEDEIESAMRRACEKQKSIGKMLVDRASWLEKILCRGKYEEREDNSISENVVLRQDSVDQRISTRSKFSRHRQKIPVLEEGEIEHEEMKNVVALSPNRDDECVPSIWGYESDSLTDSGSNSN